jgi:glycosyltransferase involved in cell wall biosynthesis
MIIINDSPEDTSYATFTINDPRIKYYKNEKNRGVNFSRNIGIEKISADSKWVLFLDDDDFFAPDTLATFYTLTLTHTHNKWFVTNRALRNGTPLTQFPKPETAYSYLWPYLITKKLKGDATHCIETHLITHNKISFSATVKQGEEWFFFYQIGLHAKMYYHDHNSTISEGYDQRNGLNFRKRNLKQNLSNIFSLFYELSQKKIFSFPLIIYLLLRILKPFFKKKHNERI